MFNKDISAGDTSQVRNTSYMFAIATALNLNVLGWETSHVTDMTVMFLSAWHFNPEIQKWVTLQVLNMEAMLQYASIAKQEITGWNETVVVGSTEMFEDVASWHAAFSRTTPSNEAPPSPWKPATSQPCNSLVCQVGSSPKVGVIGAPTGGGVLLVDTTAGIVV
eukprot:scaffold880_cov384-Prasinococcus_capsulatus_cf.AAC.3